jgi:HK97 family phage prohead protease
MSTEIRLGPVCEIRMVGKSDSREFIARAIRYNVVDDYKTIWSPGTFSDSLKTRMPRIAWAHSWTDPIGVYKEVVADNSQHLDLLGKLSDFDAVPRARQAHAQMQDGTIDNFSVGFGRQEWTRVGDLDESDQRAGAMERMTKATLDEVSPVLVGAVPGTALLAVRSARGKVDLEAVIELARHVKAGDLTVEEADEAVRMLTLEPSVEGEPKPGDLVDEAEAAAALEEVMSELDDALTRSRR